MTIFIISSHCYTLRTNVYDLVCCSLFNIFLSQAEFQCNNINLNQHVVRLLRLMVGSLKQYNRRVIPYRQVHKWPDGLYNLYNLFFFFYWKLKLLGLSDPKDLFLHWVHCTNVSCFISLCFIKRSVCWMVPDVGKKELESTLSILQDFLSEVTYALWTLIHFLQVSNDGCIYFWFPSHKFIVGLTAVWGKQTQ